MQKRSHLVSIGLFVLSLTLNFLSARGLILSYTQAQISNTYDNVLAPDYFTFGIWGIIYFLFALSLLFPLLSFFGYSLKRIQESLAPWNCLWLLLNCAWIVTWSSDFLGISLVIISVYLWVLWQINKYLASHVFSKELLVMKVIYGLHFGWLLVAWFANLMTLLVKIGLSGSGALGILLALILLAILAFLIYYSVTSLGNLAIGLSFLWALTGIASKNASSSFYIGASDLIYLAAWSVFWLFVLLFGLYIWHSKWWRSQS